MASVHAQTFGRYELLELLAQGGMGQVYRAILRGGPGFAKEVALKRVLKALGSDPIFVTRFADEARIASTLSHGNIVQVFDFGEVDGEYYLAMEFIDGPDLGTLVAAARATGKPLPIPFALQVGAGLCRGLGAAHGRRDINDDPTPVVHRDISPPNVLLTRAGEIKVTDFGIAKAADKALRTQTGMVMGKCRYMSPEQAAGEKVTPATDIFSAGCVLYELLVGEPLFEGRTVDQILRNVLLSPIPRPSHLRAEIPAELDAILARALHRDHRERYSDGTALARELESLLHTLAPHYSRDDVSALIGELVPARPRRASSLQGKGGHEAPATYPARVDTTQPPLPIGQRPTVEARGGTELGIGDATPAPLPLVDDDQGTAPRERRPAPAKNATQEGATGSARDSADAALDDTGAATAPRPKREASPRGTPEQKTALLDRGDANSPPAQSAALAPTSRQESAEPQTIAPEAPARGDDACQPSTMGQADPSRRPPLLIGAIAGLALGVLAGAFWPVAAPSAPVAQRGLAQSGSWRVEVLEGRLYRGGEAPTRRRIAFSVRASGPDTKAIPRYFGLRRGASPTASPLAWQRQGPNRTLLIFAWPKGRGPLRLRFAPPNAAPIEVAASLATKTTP